MNYKKKIYAQLVKTKYTPKVGDSVQGDKWGFPEELKPSDGYSDSSYPGCQFRVHTTHGFELGINIKVSGSPKYIGNGRYKSRIQIEFVGDGEPSTFSGGWIFHNM